MLERVSTILQHILKIAENKPLVLGVSGGPDSLTMLDLAARLGHPLIAAHLNHNLRPASALEAEKVRAEAAAREALFVLANEDVAAYARENLLSIEEAARNLRYRFLFNTARQHGAGGVLVAHTADDQVETVLMHLLRGAGLAGLKGMEPCLIPNPWDDDIPLFRPLLNVWREEIVQYCLEHSLDPTLDPSNQDPRFFRNRLRHELIPYLESYNPGVRQSIHRMADALGGDHRVIEGLVEGAFDRGVRAQGKGFIALAVQALQQEPDGIRRRLVRRAINQLRPGLRDIDFAMVERALRAVEAGPSPARRDLGAGLFILVEAELIWLAAWEGQLPGLDLPQLPLGENQETGSELSVPGSLQLTGDWKITAGSIQPGLEAYRQVSENQDPYRAWLDLERVELPLRVRLRKPGDRFRPLGMQGHSLKLADFMINRKIPFRARAGWPLVCSGEEIVWVPGLRLGHPFRLTPETRQAVLLRMERDPSNGEER